MVFYTGQCKDMGDKEPYYSTKILISSFIWAGLVEKNKTGFELGTLCFEGLYHLAKLHISKILMSTCYLHN